MRWLIVAVVAVVVVAIAVAVLGVIGPYLAGLGVVAALVVILNPGGVGARLRESPGWWAIPGMRAASRGAASFAALLLLYSVPAPLAAFGLVHAVRSSPSSGAPEARNGVGGGSTTSAVPSPSTPASTFPLVTATITTPSPSPSDTPTPTPAPTPTAVPEASSTLQPIPVATATPAPTAAPPPPPPPTPSAQNLCGAPANPWGYNFCGGSGRINNPPSDFCSYFTCIASFWQQTNGYVEECNDGTYSHSGGQVGSCSSHKGNKRPLNP